MNVFDYAQPKAYIRQNRTKKKRKAGVTYSDVLCHSESWSVRGIGEKRQDELMHWGIKGQKWGIRRFQNEDGSLTEEGKKRYNAGYSYGQKIFESDQLKGKALIGLGPKGVLKYGKYVRKKEKEEFERRYGKTKEEQKKNIDKEWEELTKKEDAERYLGQKMKKFDKASPEEQDKTLKEVKAEIDRLDAKMKKDGGLNHDDDTMRDGLLDWYQTEDDKRTFNSFKKDVKEKEPKEWFSEYGPNDKKFDKIFDHINRKEGKLLNEWWEKREEVRGDRAAGDKLQQQYMKKLAKDLDLPETPAVYRLLEDWFITWDD